MKKALIPAIIVCIILLLFTFIMPQIPVPSALRKKAQSRKEVSDEEVAPSPVKVSVIFDDDFDKTQRKESQAGTFPPVWASYREEVGFKRYRKELTARGAVFFFYDADQRRCLQIDFKRDKMMPFDVARIGTDFAPRPSQIENEPALAALVTEFTEYGSNVFLARPFELEKRIENQLDAALQKAGLSVSEVLGFRGYYDYKLGRFQLHITDVSLRDEGLKAFWATVNL